MSYVRDKTCKSCGQVKAPAEFYPHPEMADGRLSHCKECQKAKAREWRRASLTVREYDRERSKTPQRRAHSRAVTAKFRTERPEAHRAHAAVNKAVRSGKLVRGPCLFCGSAEHVHGHHRDYSKPLDVVWLCARCHHRLHATLPETAAHERAERG